MHIYTDAQSSWSFFGIQTKQFKEGEEVLVKNDKNLVKELQVGHGGWNEAMVSVSFFICFLSLKLSDFCNDQKSAIVTLKRCQEGSRIMDLMGMLDIA